MYVNGVQIKLKSHYLIIHLIFLTVNTRRFIPLYLCMCPSGIHCSSLSHHHWSVCHTPHDFRS